MTITEAQAREAIAKKEEQNANKYIQRLSGGIDIINGPYGPYISNGKKNARIPKDKDPKNITEDEAKQLLEAAPDKRRRFKQKSSK